MYSPKIREDLIPRIYRAARDAQIAMTKWVNHVLEHALPVDRTEPAGEVTERKENTHHE